MIRIKSLGEKEEVLGKRCSEKSGTEKETGAQGLYRGHWEREITCVCRRVRMLAIYNHRQAIS